jgi:hypothetical protein
VASLAMQARGLLPTQDVMTGGGCLLRGELPQFRVSVLELAEPRPLRLVRTVFCPYKNICALMPYRRRHSFASVSASFTISMMCSVNRLRPPS